MRRVEKKCLRIAAVVCLLAVMAGCAEKMPQETHEAENEITPEQRAEWFEKAAGNRPPHEPEDLVAQMLPSASSPEGLAAEHPEYPIYRPGEFNVDDPPEYSLPVRLDESRKIRTELNFKGASLEEVVTVFANILEFNYLLDGKFDSPVTIVLNEHLTKQEIWTLFKQLLRHAGAYASYDDKIVHIRALADARQNQTREAAGSEVEMAMIPLKNLPVKELGTQITPFLSPGVQPIELESRNALLILDTKEALLKVRQLIAMLDQPARREWCRMVIPCREVSPVRLAAELGEILPVLGFPVSIGPEKPAADAIQIVPQERLQILIATAANAEALEEVERWLPILDRSEVGDQERIFIYDIMHTSAEALVNAASMMFNVEASVMQPNTSSRFSSKTAGARTGGDTTAASSRRSERDDQEGYANIFDIPVKIFADGDQNRLLVRTTPRTYAMLKALMEKIDTVPAQVLLQVLVIEVTLNDSVQFGIEFMMQGGGDSVEGIGGTNFKNLVPGVGQESQYGATYWLYNPSNPDEKYGYLNALAGQTNVKVISSPQVLVVSHREAEISVGDTVPIVNSEITNTQSTTSDDNNNSTNLVRNIRYEDTGIILKVVPHVTRGGEIMLEMEQTVSEAIVNKTSNIDSPEIQKRILRTTMNFSDGQTIICGGIIREKATDNLDTVPILGQIPFLRRLLGNTDVTTQRTEMLILLSGTIVNKSTKLDDLLRRYEQSVDSLIEFTNHNGRNGNKNSANLSTWFFE